MSDRKMGHVLPLKTYLLVFSALVILTVITVWAGNQDFGSFGNIVAVGIAAIKASLVTLFFMHGKYEGKGTWAFIIYPAVLLFLLIGGLFLDYTTRRSGSFTLKEPVINHGTSQGHGEGAAGGEHGDSHGNGADNAHGQGGAEKDTNKTEDEHSSGH